MTSEIGVRDLKTNATRIVRAVREEGAEYVVTVRGKPAAILRPITAEDDDRHRQERAAAFLAGLEALSREMARYPRERSAVDQLLADRSED